MTEDDPYSKREQDYRFGELFKRMDAQDSTLTRIEAQTTKTNGKVVGLEAKYLAIMAFFGLAAAFLGFFIPYSLNVTKKDLEISNQQSIEADVSETVPVAVDQAISVLEKKYEIQVDNNQ